MELVFSHKTGSSPLFPTIWWLQCSLTEVSNNEVSIYAMLQTLFLKLKYFKLDYVHSKFRRYYYASQFKYLKIETQRDSLVSCQIKELVSGRAEI